jgi:hypothetical protein
LTKNGLGDFFTNSSDLVTLATFHLRMIELDNFEAAALIGFCLGPEIVGSGRA